MKKGKRAIAIVAGAAALWLAFSLRRIGWESDFGRPWQVDLEASVSRVNGIPHGYQGRFSSLDDYRNFVRQRASGLTLAIYDNGTASMTGGWFGSANPSWRKDDKADYWIYTRNFFSASVGHGFTRTSSRTARLQFQLEWNENAATRETLVLRRD